MSAPSPAQATETDPRQTHPGPRPRVVVTTTTSVDGRVSLSRHERLLDPDVSERWRSGWASDTEEVLSRRERWIAETWAPTVVLEGSGSFVGPEERSRWTGDPDVDEGAPRPHPAAPQPQRPADHVPRSSPRWFAVVDGRGRVDWTFTGDEQTALVVLACARTPAGYLAHLREIGVAHLVRGDDRVDLGAAVAALGAVLGATAVVADGGGGLTAALLAAGLVDELHVVTIPMLVGGAESPSLLDGPGLGDAGRPQRLQVVESVVGHAGTRWTRYVTARR